MIRMSILSMAFLVLTGTMATQAEETKVADKEGFRVYTIAPRCLRRTLVGVYSSHKEAIQVATEQRTKAWNVEVTTGSEGKQFPNRQPALYLVYSMVCSKSGWQRQGIYVDEKKAGEVAKTLVAKDETVEIIRDYAPKEVYHTYGVQCKGTKRLQGTYVTMEEAFDAAKALREKGIFRCDVVTGTKGEDALPRSPMEYKVYSQGCKRSNWELATTTNDPKKAQEVVAAQKKENRQVEIVLHFVPAK